ncbi:hypothetical protein [Methylobacterium sp. J-070]|uniref:hypothetical protein n=1 Tax=Methylobacterium sp. J-070 TaxID=2836650 RepID=UPI001FB8C366|nr:hypothetical protein [Methylobacterium sp. J-070]MCJ2050515.1 hypothetical protein [Methylobacterium sp. J-070]
MRAGPKPLPAALILPVVLMAIAPAAARPESRPHPGRHHPPAGSDMDLTLSRMAARAQRDWRIWQAPRPLALALPPATRERVAAPPFTGWGYGGTVPGAWPGF